MANWNLDSAHSEIEFKVKHMMISTVKGTFNEFNVTVENAGEQFETAQVQVNIQAASINTKSEQRDQHLKVAISSMLQLARNQICIQQHCKDGDDEYKITGDLTIKDVTKPATFQVEFGGLSKRPLG